MAEFFNKESMPKCIILDWDGTLVDIEPVIHKAYKETLKEINSPLKDAWSPIDTHAQNGLAPADIFNNKLIWGEHIGENGLAKKLFYQNYHKFMTEDENAPYLKDGALELLQTINAAYPTTRVVILAAKTNAILKQEVEKKPELAPWVHVVLGTDPERGFSKQNDIIFYEAVYGLTISKDPEIRKKEVIHIGDNIDKDNYFAQICGISSIVINDKNKEATHTSLKEVSDEIKSAFRERNMALLKNKRNIPSASDMRDTNSRV